jgi:hypothetical protein
MVVVFVEAMGVEEGVRYLPLDQGKEGEEKDFVPTWNLYNPLARNLQS